MAISQMAKIMIVSHRSQARELLEALQSSGLCQILNAEQAMITKEWPELIIAADRVRETEELLDRLSKSAVFLKDYTDRPKGLAAVLSPRTVIDNKTYEKIVANEEILQKAQKAEETEAAIEKIKTKIENIEAVLEQLEPWQGLETAVEELGQLKTTTALTGLLPIQKFEQIATDIAELDAAIEKIGTSGNNHACLVVCLKENTNKVQKLLRSADFEAVSFEPMKGTIAELIEQHLEKLNEAKKQLNLQYETAAELAGSLLEIQTFCDHYTNLSEREHTESNSPATEQTVIFEGWVKQKNYRQLEKIISKFSASNLSKIKPAEGEDIPVEIENKKFVRPFEVITRLYGMPQHFEVDPTVFLAPFFALFFALCLTDAGYGLIIIALTVYLIKKMQGDKKLIWMLGICSAVTVVAGALTGGWFGDGIQQFIPALAPVREKMMWFDPLEKPMMFFALSLIVGYIQLLAGLVIAFIHNLKQKDYIAAVCDQLTWLVMLNSIVIFLAGKSGAVPVQIGGFCGKLALIPAVMILLFSQREGRWGGRLGMGAYNLFSTIFYMGDVLSYLRLMALGMVTAGLAMAVNVMAQVASQAPWGIGIIAAAIVLIIGHGGNLALSALSAFVHTLRLQYVEFFPKFLAGGGRAFEPLSKKYKYIYIGK